jgi:hypothetical protein
MRYVMCFGAALPHTNPYLTKYHITPDNGVTLTLV